MTDGPFAERCDSFPQSPQAMEWLGGPKKSFPGEKSDVHGLISHAFQVGIEILMD